MVEEKKKKLTLKEDAFCDFYVNDIEHQYNASSAARNAGYSEKTATAIGSENLRKPHIRERITELIEEKTDIRAELRERVIAEYKKIAFSDIKHFLDITEFTQEGDVITVARTSVNIKALQDIDGSCIESIKETKDGISFKLHDKMKALDKLGLYSEMFSEKDESNNVTIIINE